ncbi:MAG: quinolinate synthase NadA [Desulfamplus sp.]|nr:quinolinate synthase NadA [Desulfamplus sp.]
MSDLTLKQEVMQTRRALGKSVVIPAHHYEMDEVVQMADFLGDSYKLAVDCAATDSQYIVFCGVMFMAEGAALLAKPYQKVLIPDMTAGCPMADMIDSIQAEKIYDRISKMCDRQIIPIVYMNSYADMKAFCGSREGTVCTSSNATKIVRHFLDQGKSVFFAPDYNLGINTANQLGLARDEVVTIRRDLSVELYDPDLEGYDHPKDGKKSRKTNSLKNSTLGDSALEESTLEESALKDATLLKKAKMFVWDGFCHVHKVFTVNDINSFRRQYGDPGSGDGIVEEQNVNESIAGDRNASDGIVGDPGSSGSAAGNSSVGGRQINVIVHPECHESVVEAADYSGSTSMIWNTVKAGKPGSIWAVGTEFRFVQRMADQFKDKTVVPLRKSVCHNMSKITLEKLGNTLKSVQDHISGSVQDHTSAEGRLLNQVTVSDEYKEDAKKALQLMIDIVEAGK